MFSLFLGGFLYNYFSNIEKDNQQSNTLLPFKINGVRVFVRKVVIIDKLLYNSRTTSTMSFSTTEPPSHYPPWPNQMPPDMRWDNHFLRSAVNSSKQYRNLPRLSPVPQKKMSNSFSNNILNAIKIQMSKRNNN